ncbi:hypothetical protein HMSSN139_63610 [Paenibacillus sp. HMSSN-139]|nr:hypothetical protein HMSSN139_63610 [Paenibacillus sp. HMSSN-139]
MHVVVILKQTFDTEEKIVITDGKVSEDGVKFVINPYDEYAVEEALRLKEAHGGTVTVVSAGPERTAERCAPHWPWEPMKPCGSPRRRSIRTNTASPACSPLSCKR